MVWRSKFGERPYSESSPGIQELHTRSPAKSKGCTEETLKRELQTMSLCAHENVVAVYGYKSYRGKSLQIVMEKMETDLRKVLKKRQLETGSAFSPLEVRWVLQSVARALQFMSNKRIYHRDLKLDNVMLTSHMDIKIGDFGMAVQ
eukprot:gene1420-1918_t